MTARKKGKEKRKHKRIKYYCLIKYRLSSRERVYSKTVTSLRNIGGGGIMFKTDETLPVGVLLDVEINMPVFKKVIKAVAKVKWTERVWSSQRHEVGIEFLNIDETERKEIVEFADNAEKNEA